MIKTYKSDLIFTVLFALFSLVYYSGIMSEGPLNMHTWRQTDCLSLTQHYAEGNSFFEPEMHIQLGDNLNSGKSAGEFPVLYYFVGQLWSFTGQSYFLYRLFYLVILFIGTFSIFRLVKALFKSDLWAYFVSLLLFTSPVYIFYGVSFLTDVPAMCFVFTGLLMLYHYAQKGKSRFFIFAMMLFALGGLIKISSLIAFIFLLFIFCVEWIFGLKSLGNRKLFRKPTKEWLGFAGVFILLFAWYYYAHLYNAAHGFKYTFNNIYPFWIMSDAEFSKTIEGIKNTTSHILFSRPLLWFLLLSFLFNLTLWRKIPFLAYTSNIVVSLGVVLYLILWFPLLGVHDYYFSAVLIIYPAILLPTIYYLWKHKEALFHSFRLKLMLGVFLVFNFLYAQSIMALKTTSNSGNHLFVGNHALVKELQWFNTDNQTNFQRYERMQPYLNKLGIDNRTKVISIPDPSFNATLFMMNRKGWTNFLDVTDKGRIDSYIKHGAEYLLIGNKQLTHKESLQPYLNEKVGTFEGIHIYKL